MSFNFDLVFYKSPYVCVIFGLILLLHIISAALSNRISQIISYVNIGLHLALVVLLFFTTAAELSELVLLFMASLFIYLVSNLVLDKVRSKNATRSNKEIGGDEQ